MVRLGFTKKRVHHYLWYSVVLLVPFVHELGHVLFSWLLGESVVLLEWNMVWRTDIHPYSFLVCGIWDCTPLLTLLCVSVWFIVEMKEFRFNKKDCLGVYEVE